MNEHGKQITSKIKNKGEPSCMKFGRDLETSLGIRVLALVVVAAFLLVDLALLHLTHEQLSTWCNKEDNIEQLYIAYKNKYSSTCTSMCVYIYIHMDTHLFYTCVHVYTHMVHTYIYIYNYNYIYIYIYVHNKKTRAAWKALVNWDHHPKLQDRNGK